MVYTQQSLVKIYIHCTRNKCWHKFQFL